MPAEGTFLVGNALLDSHAAKQRRMGYPIAYYPIGHMTCSSQVKVPILLHSALSDSQQPRSVRRVTHYPVGHVTDNSHVAALSRRRMSELKAPARIEGSRKTASHLQQKAGQRCQKADVVPLQGGHWLQGGSVPVVSPQ